MRAVVFHRHGPAHVLEVDRAFPDPSPGPDDALVRVAAAGVSFADTWLRSGRLHSIGHAPPARFPVVPGGEVAGTVVGVGAHADPALVGRRVVAVLAAGCGGYAEYAGVPAGHLIALPEGLGPADAVALAVAGSTAVGVVAAARLTGTETVLVEGAGGGVGHLLLQLLRGAGAFRILALAHGDARQSLARECGADHVIDSRDPDWPGLVADAAGPAGVDVVLDTVGGSHSRTALGLLNPGTGRLVAYGTVGGDWPEITPADLMYRGVALVGYGGQAADPLARRALTVAALAAGLRPHLGLVRPLDGAAEAHQAIQTGTLTGKAVLLP
ncbi:zinc-binding alcohol dehydrogenase family protein [Kitasatospora sp. NPDC058201]|uniref:quinone oxidoreductase family protein n=1 Tax=unclassified Kitasatospora TaxID=2633591 RepID=UPI00364F0571